MSILKITLNELNIHTDKDLEKYIDKKYANQENIPLKIVKKSDLELDNENRTYKPVFEYENTIFDVDELVIKNSKSIKFKNCIFTGRLHIQNNENHNLEIYFDYVGVKDSLSFVGCKNISSICLAEVNTPKLFIRSIETESLHISGSNIVDFMCNSSIINKCDVYFNSFNNLEISDNKMDKVYFPQSQLTLSTFVKALDEKSIKVLQEDFLYLKFPKDIDYDNYDKIDKSKRINDTCKFLIENSDYHVSKQDLAEIKYLEGLSAIKNNTSYIWVYQLFGGLIKPGRILLLIFLTIFIFSIIFYFFPFTFDDECERNFSNAMYFSGITFATIGYGDISPTGMGRFLAILEGIIGILLSSSFIISLIRRYMD